MSTEEPAAKPTLSTRALAAKVAAEEHYKLKPRLTVALVVWLVLVIAAGGTLFLAMVGALNNETEWSDDGERVLGIEIASQILNGLFTVAAFFNHPTRIVWTYWLCKAPHRLDERFNPLNFREIGWILLNLNFNCIFQYGMLFTMVYYNRFNRPAWSSLFLVASFGTGIAGGCLEARYRSRRAAPMATSRSRSSSGNSSDHSGVARVTPALSVEEGKVEEEQA